MSSVGQGTTRTFVALAALLTLLGFGLRFYHLTSQSLWTDEVSSIQVAEAPLAQLVEESGSVNNSLPTYFLVLRRVLNGAKVNVEFRARALSALAGGMSIPVFMGVVYLWRRRQDAALVAGFLLGVHPLHIWYSQEARGYAVMLFFGLLTLLFFELARERKKLALWFLYTFSALASIAFHKTGLVFPAACGLWHGWGVLREHKSLRALLAHVPVALAVVAVFILKSYPPAEPYSRRASGLEILYTFMTFGGGYSFGPSLTDIQSYGPWAAVTRHWLQVGFLGAVLLMTGLGVLFEGRELLRGRETGLLLLGLGVVAGYGLVSGFPYNVRYALPALFGFLGLVAALVCPLRRAQVDGPAPPSSGTRGNSARRGHRWCSRLGLAGLVLIALWADGQWYFSPTYRKGDSRGVAAWLVANRDTVKSWTVLPGYLSRSVEWYLQPQPDILARSCPAREDRTTSFPPVPDVLILGRRHHLQAPDQIVADYRAQAGNVRALDSIAGFELYVRSAASSRTAAGTIFVCSRLP